MIAPGALAEGTISVTDLFARHADSIVLIVAQHKGRKEDKLGSGFIVREDGLIVTNYHLVKKAKKIFVKFRNNKVYRDIQVVSTDVLLDIALIKINAHGLKALTFGNSDKIAIGERVVTIGNPLGLESSVADGLISALRHTDKGIKVFQISVPLSQGNSGGPLFNLEGEVIGITTASQAQGQNLNFAVPINYVKPFFKKADHHTAAVKGYKGKAAFFPGQKKVSSQYPPVFSYPFYTVLPKDTLYSLARKFGTTVEEIMRLNRLTDTTIYKGQKIKIPLTPFEKRGRQVF